MTQPRSSLLTKNWTNVSLAASGLAIVILLIVGLLAYTSRETPAYESNFTAKVPDRPLRVSVIGDSYSAGNAQNAVKWPDLFAKKRGWYLNNVAESGTGYVATDQKFYSRARYALETDPDVILIVGGFENRAFPPGMVQSEALKLYEVLKLKAPGSQIFVIGPISDSTAPDPNLVAAASAIRTATEIAGLTYTDTLSANWLRDSNLVQEDRSIPTDAGMRTLAEAVDSAVPQIPPGNS
ncbi:SGNH/GDSL hydrolase family protein [Rhodococcus fascians]|nr:SGNH/GDSL hydrolase family protein [Rhodococcus fascians]